VKVLVTGGVGFIGSHVVEQLLARGHVVRVLDDLSTGKRGHLPLGRTGLTFIRGNVADGQVVGQAMQGMEGVIHLAAVASVQASIADPIGTHQTNLVGTLHLLEAARREKVGRFVYASSAAVYGDAADLPVGEESRLQPLSPYAIDKLSGEYYLRQYHRLYALNSLCLRFFNVYGPRQDPSSPYSGVISIFTDRAAAGKPVTIYGDGLQSRDFVYVGDLAELVVRGLSVPVTSPVILNIGTGRPTSLLELLETLEGLLGRAIERHFEPRRAGDIRHSLADDRRLRRVLGETTWTPLHVGLKRLMQEGVSCPNSTVPETES
jgi:UDP-glucose 4-epimerase